METVRDEVEFCVMKSGVRHSTPETELLPPDLSPCLGSIGPARDKIVQHPVTD